MRKLLLLFLSLILFFITVSAKTTYIPSYWSYIKIFQYEGDSVAIQNKLGQAELASLDETFRITVVHEDLTREKAKKIKQLKAAAGWSIVAAIMAGATAGFNSATYNNALLTYVDMKRLENNVALSSIVNREASAEERLSIELFIDNLSTQELIISDIARGLVWYVLPHTTIQFNMINPGIEQLRISDLHHKNVQYADIIGANFAQKMEIEYEDDECWIPMIFKGNSPDYYYISKKTFKKYKITAEKVKEYKKKKRDAN